MLISKIDALTVWSTAIEIGKLYTTLNIPKVTCKTKNNITIYPIFFICWLDCIKNKSNPEVSLNDGLIAVATGEAAEKSIKENRVVKLSEFNL